MFRAFVRSRSKTYRYDTFYWSFLVELGKVSELTSIRLINNKDRLTFEGLSVHAGLIEDSFIPFVSSSLTEFLQLCITMSIRIFEILIIKDYIYFVVGVHQEEVGDCCMNSWLSLTTGNHPNLWLFSLRVLKCKGCSGELKGAKLCSNFFKS